MKYRSKVKFFGEMLLLYFSMLSVRSKKIYVFGAWQGKKFSDNPKYLFLQAIKDPNIKSVWITKSDKIYREMKKQSYPVYMHNSIQGIYYQLRASLYFTCERKNDVSALLIGNATRINLWHGVGLKKILHDVKKPNLPTNTRKKYLRKIRSYPYRKEYVLSTSETMSKIFSNAFRKPFDKILELGQPRNDIFFDDGLETESLPFLAGRRMILYMPTHRKEGKEVFAIDKIIDISALNEFCQNNNLVFVIKKHFFHRSESEDLSNFKNVVDITNTEFDTQLLLKKAEVLITDYSSCYVDYLLLNKAVIFYNFDYEDYVLNDRDLYFDYESTTPGPKVKSFNELLGAIQQSLLGDQEIYGGERSRVKNIFYSNGNQKAVGAKILRYVQENV